MKNNVEKNWMKRPKRLGYTALLIELNDQKSVQNQANESKSFLYIMIRQVFTY